MLRPRLDEIAREMVEAIRTEVPSYGRHPDSRFCLDLVNAVRRCLYQFVELIEDPDCAQEHHVAFFRRLGKTEYRNGRSMDGLQAAYRVAARVALRRYAEAAKAAAFPVDTVLLLSDAALVHINGLANESVKGYLDAQSGISGNLPRSRHALALRLLERSTDPAGTATDLLAIQAEWSLPDTIACLVMEISTEGEPFDTSRIDGDVLMVYRGRELCLLVPHPDKPGRIDGLRAVVRGRIAALGPTVPLADGWLSAHCARLALYQARRGLLDTADLVVTADHLGALVLLGDERISELLIERTLGALSALPPGKADRLRETLYALLTSRGRTAPEVATALGVHPQTARSRLRQLDALFGDRLSDPAFRFEAELALRANVLVRAARSPSRLMA